MALSRLHPLLQHIAVGSEMHEHNRPIHRRVRRVSTHQQISVLALQCRASKNAVLFTCNISILKKKQFDLNINVVRYLKLESNPRNATFQFRGAVLSTKVDGP